MGNGVHVRDISIIYLRPFLLLFDNSGAFPLDAPVSSRKFLCRGSPNYLALIMFFSVILDAHKFMS